MRKCLALMLVIAGIAMSLTGCTSDDSAVTETTIEVKKNGSVVHTIVEDFSEDYYELEDLRTTIQSACDTYNGRAGRDTVTVGSLEESEGVLTAVMNYKSTSAYAEFNKQALFAGTIKDAYNAGYDLDVTLFPAQEADTPVEKEELLAMGEKHIVILREAVDVMVWNKILYFSDSVIRTNNKKMVTVTDDSKLTYIVFE